VGTLISVVCQKWNQLAFDSGLWRGICIRRNIPVSRPSNLTCLAPTPSSDCEDPMLVSPHCTPSHHNTFVSSYMRELNWQSGKYRTVSLKGHKEIVWSLLHHPEDNTLISGSEDMTIKLWDLDEGVCTQTFRGHKNGTICLGRYGRRIVSGSADGSIKVWDMDTGACVHTIQTHSSVWSLQLVEQGTKLLAGCVDASIRVFDLNTALPLNTFRGHTAPVRCLQVAEGFGELMIISGSYDRSIKFWDLSGQCLNTIRAHTHKINCLQFDGRTMVSGSHDTLVKVWDLNGHCLHTLQGHDNMIHCLQFKGSKLLTGSSDSMVKVWDLQTGNHVNTIKNHSAVCAVQFDDNLLISGYEDSVIQVYDFSA